MMIDSTLEYLYQLHNRGIKLGLENINKILHECNNPHDKFKSIHLAGTNGKGSTASIIKNLTKCRTKGWALYITSLINFNERIRINGEPISDSDIISFTKTYRNFLKNTQLRFSKLLLQWHLTILEKTRLILQ